MLTEAQLQILLRTIGRFVAARIGTRCKPMEQRIAALEAKLNDFGYRGVWSEQQPEYQVGNFVTHQGSLWHCNCAGTMARPGTSRHWTLAVKRGASARDIARGAPEHEDAAA